MGKRISPLVPLENIDRVPVTFIHGVLDDRCPTYQAEYFFNRIKTTEKYFVMRKGDHYEYLGSVEHSFVNQMVDIIETGYIDRDKDYSRAISPLHTLSALTLIALTAMQAMF